MANVNTIKSSWEVVAARQPGQLQPLSLLSHSPRLPSEVARTDTLAQRDCQLITMQIFGQQVSLELRSTTETEGGKQTEVATILCHSLCALVPFHCVAVFTFPTSLPPPLSTPLSYLKTSTAKSDTNFNCDPDSTPDCCYCLAFVCYCKLLQLFLQQRFSFSTCSCSPSPSLFLYLLAAALCRLLKVYLMKSFCHLLFETLPTCRATFESSNYTPPPLLQLCPFIVSGRRHCQSFFSA